MPAHLVMRDGSPWWISPDIWVVPGKDPNGAPGSPVAGQANYLWARVANTGNLDLRRAYRLLLSQQPPREAAGTWRVSVSAQDVNLARPGTPPEIAARHIGGFFVASAIELTFDPPLPCPLKAQARVLVA